MPLIQLKFLEPMNLFTIIRIPKQILILSAENQLEEEFRLIVHNVR